MKKSLKKISITLAIMAIAATGQATEVTMQPVVVSATKIATPLNEVASSVTVITREEIAQKQAVHVSDVLRSVPGLDVARPGGLGQQTSVFLRGANSAHTLVLIDGIEMNDPSNPGRLFDFANLSTDNVERIEILRGPGSTLYGSDAMGGVINIITRKGDGATRFDVQFEAGSYDTQLGRITVSGGTERINYSLEASSMASEGISAAGEKYGNSEEDGYERRAIAARVGLNPLDNLSFDLFLRYNESETDVDTFGGQFGDDPNNVVFSQSLNARLQGTLLLFDGLWEQTLGVSLSDSVRSNRDGKDVDHPFDTIRSHFESELVKTDWQHNFYLCPNNTLTVGVEHEEEQAKGSDYRTYLDWWTFMPASSFTRFGEETARITGYYLQDQLQVNDNFSVTLGLRLDDHDRFGTEETWRVTGSYTIPETGTRIKGTYGTAFKAPTLYQLYENSAYVAGNRHLDPEQSRGWDLGLEQMLFEERVTIGVTYFENTFEDLIDAPYNPALMKWEYTNVDKAETRGVELTLSARPSDDLVVKAGYTYTDTKDTETDARLLRRPLHKYSVNLGYDLTDDVQVNLDLIHVGERDDYGSPATVVLKKYTVVNLAGSWQVGKNLAFTARVENLFDQKYEEVYGFGTPGLSGTLGARLSF